ncbi:hypothetical protein [Microviridae sp.]|nr:hypothetical protein [Microviridae sp.]
MYRRNTDPDYNGCKGEKNSKPSMTVPDQALGIRTLLDHHSRGIPNNVQHHEGEYFDTDVPHIQDLNDLQDIRDQNVESAAMLEQAAKAEIDKATEMRSKELKKEAKAEILDEINNSNKRAQDESTDEPMS